MQEDCMEESEAKYGRVIIKVRYMEVKLYWQSIKNEIDAETWKSARCYITEDKAEERSEAQTGVENLDINYCYRKIEEGISSIQEVCHKFMVGFSRNKEKAYKYASPDVKVGDVIMEKTDTNVKYGLVGSVGSYIIKNRYLVSGTEVSDTDAIVNYFVNNGAKPTGTTAIGTAEAVGSDSEITVLYTEEINDKLHNNVDYWELSFGVFRKRQNVDMNLLSVMLHKYVVLNVLQEWSKITNPGLTKEYYERLNNEVAAIKRLIYRKEEPDWNE